MAYGPKRQPHGPWHHGHREQEAGTASQEAVPKNNLNKLARKIGIKNIFRAKPSPAGKARELICKWLKESQESARAETTRLVQEHENHHRATTMKTRYCGNCGNCGNCGTSTKEEGQLYCTECGAEMPEQGLGPGKPPPVGRDPDPGDHRSRVPDTRAHAGRSHDDGERAKQLLPHIQMH